MFAEVSPKIEEFNSAVFVVFDELPIPFADGAGGTAALVGVMGKMAEKPAV